MPGNAPLKYLDILNAVRPAIRQATPASLAFMLSPETRGIPEVPADFDRRRLPFADIPMLLRDQRQHSLANPPQNTPFSIFNAIHDVRTMTNTPK